MTAFSSYVAKVGERFELPTSAIPESVEAHPLPGDSLPNPRLNDRVLYTWEEKEPASTERAGGRRRSR